uniref:Uncharacterized protein n=1 Tax=Magallana gigas TaxID=29159 RepID=A0A8W8MCS8_MAGGI
MLEVSLIKSEICPRENARQCCVGFKWNDTQETCLPCDKGYVGINCSSNCIFPWYGLDCMSNCNCTENNCDHVYGCVISNEDVTLADDLDEEMTVIGKRETEPLKINVVVYSIIGLVATSVLFIVLYFCTQLMEKC